MKKKYKRYMILLYYVELYIIIIINKFLGIVQTYISSVHKVSVILINSKLHHVR